MRYRRLVRANGLAGALCAAILAAPGRGNAQDALIFATRLDAHNIGITPTAPTDTGIFIPAGAEVFIGSALAGAQISDIPLEEIPHPFTLYAWLQGQESGAVAVRPAEPVRFEASGILQLGIGDVACGASGSWNSVMAAVSVSYDRVVTAEDGDRAGAWGPPIVRLAGQDGMRITAEGGVAYWEGEPYGLEGQGKLMGDTLAPGLFANALIGQIGENGPFLVGAAAADRGEDGWLWITVNDQIDKPGAYRNNSGRVSLTVDVTRAASEVGILNDACSDNGGTAPVSEQVSGITGETSGEVPGDPTTDETSGVPLLELPIAPGQVMVTGAHYRTADNALSLVFREDGQLVVQRADGSTIWSSLAAGAPAVPGGSVMVGYGGELAFFDAARQLVWEPVGERAVPGSVLYIDDAQVLTMLSPSWTVTWAQDPAAGHVQAAIPAAPAVPAAPAGAEAPSVRPPGLVPANPGGQAEVAPVAPVIQDPAEDPVVDMAEAPADPPGAEPEDASGQLPGGVEGQSQEVVLTTMWRQEAGECLTIGLGRLGREPGAAVGMAPCDFSAEQNWVIIPLPDGYGYIANAAGEPALCLSSGDGSTTEPRALAITAQACAETPEQIWEILPQENGYYRLGSLSYNRTMCLEGASPDFGILDGAAFMDGCEDVTGQYWALFPREQ